MYLFAENLVPDIECYERDRYIGQLLAILLGHIHDTLSEVVPESYEYPTPEGRSDECDRDKWSHWHTKNTSRYRDQMTNHRDQSSNKSIDLVILQEEIFGSLIFLWGDEDIFAIFCEKWFAEPLAEDIVVEECTNNRTDSTDECREYWINMSTCSRYSGGYHHKLRRHREYR